MDASNGLIDAEISWRTSRTFEVFYRVWKVDGQVLAGQRWDANDYRYQHVKIRPEALTVLQKLLTKLESTAQIYFK